MSQIGPLGQFSGANTEGQRADEPAPRAIKPVSPSRAGAAEDQSRAGAAEDQSRAGTAEDIEGWIVTSPAPPPAHEASEHDMSAPLASADLMPAGSADARPAVPAPFPAAASAPPPAMRRVVHMHIPKTAGTALRTAFDRVQEPKLRIFPNYDERQFLTANLAEWDIYSGHFGYKTATHLDGDIVTVLRHPVDRFVSVYYFWQELLEKNIEVVRKTRMTKLYSLDDFVYLRDEPMLNEEFFNRMTWQVAYGSTTEYRRELRDQGTTDNQILAMAVHNLESFAVVGLQSNMAEFSRAIKHRFDITLNIGRINVTAKRPSVDDLNTATRRRIYDWVYLDIELYEAAAQLAASRAAAV